jgi:hypothetical protein
MNLRVTGAAVLAMFAGSAGAAGAGCELLVQLDRSAVEPTVDAGCPICSTVARGDGSVSTDTSADNWETGAEAMTTDSGAGSQ